MKRIAILTDFLDHDPAYSLCGVVANQIKTLKFNGYSPLVFARKGFQSSDLPSKVYDGLTIIELDPGEIGNNVVNVTGNSANEITLLRSNLEAALLRYEIEVVLTHDAIYQANMWKYHVAIQRIAKEMPQIQWLHWVHSTTPMNVYKKTASFSGELERPIANSKLVVMTPEETMRKASTFGYELDQVHYVPNPIDLMAGYHPAAVEALQKIAAYKADMLAVYPVRLDRGKQVEIVVEIMVALRRKDYDARLIVVDFHSTAGDKATYRDELMRYALNEHLPLLFTSQLDYSDANYHIPHEAVLDLFDYSDVFIHPSRSECDPLTVPEAMWKGNLVMLNFDLPMFRMYQDTALMGKFSSNIDVTTGEAGNTNTNYGDRDAYMNDMAARIAYLLQNERVASQHIKVRKERGLEAVWKKHLWPAIEGA